MPNILGTGLSGLIGSRLNQLLTQYHFVDLSLDTGYDLLNRDQITTACNRYAGSVILHLAAFTDTTAAHDQRGDKSGLCYRLNVEGTRNVLDLCLTKQKYLVYISTDFVFDGTKRGSYTEADTPNPIDWYGQTKYEAEKLILDSGIPAVIIRIAFPYRARFLPKSDIVRKIIDKISHGSPVQLFTDQVTTPTFIDDIVYGLDYFIQHQPVGVYHLVASSSQSVYAMGREIAQIFGYDLNLIQPSLLADYLNTPDSRPWAKNLALDNQKVTSLGIKMSTLPAGLKEMKRQLS
jgi:dTDP-4-dehydrorhamnose reductase